MCEREPDGWPLLQEDALTLLRAVNSLSDILMSISISKALVLSISRDASPRTSFC